MSMTNSYNKRKLSGKPFRTTTRLRKACKMNVRVQVPTQGLVPRTSFGWYDCGIGEKRAQNEHPRLSQLWQSPQLRKLYWGPQLRELLATSGKTTTKKIGFYFFTYEWSRRRLPLIKMINGIEEVLMLLFTAFRYEYLFWSYVVRVWIVRLFILEKILFVEKTNDKKKEEGKPKNIWREKCFNKNV